MGIPTARIVRLLRNGHSVTRGGAGEPLMVNSADDQLARVVVGLDSGDHSAVPRPRAKCGWGWGWGWIQVHCCLTQEFSFLGLVGVPWVLTGSLCDRLAPFEVPLELRQL